MNRSNEQLVKVIATPMARRTFLKNSALLAVPAILGGVSLPALALTPPPVRSRGTTVLSVKTYGAVGDGIHDDTAAIQAAINALPTTGGTVTVPAGTYLIDTNKKINLRSLMLFQMETGAILKAKNCALIRHYLLYVNGKSDVEIAGGQLVGDRDGHTYSGTSTHEWGHGIQILGGKRVSVRDLMVTKCTGDGVCIGGSSSDVVIANIISTGNRRNGLSVTNCTNVKVYDSEFSFTNGTSPECGVDIEPDAGYTCSNVLLQNCRFNNNKKYGINIWKNTSAITITGSTLELNGSLGLGTNGVNGLTVTNNTIRSNSATGIVYNDGTKNLNHSGNLSYGNYTRLGAKVRTPFTQTGWTSKIERDILIRGVTSGIVVGSNNFK
jgi:polygalacturonase